MSDTREPEEEGEGPQDPFDAPSATVFGMELLCNSLDEMRHPIGAMVVVKSLEDDGEIAYRTVNTDGLSTVEALGMAEFAKLQFRDLISMNTIRSMPAEDDEDDTE